MDGVGGEGETCAGGECVACRESEGCRCYAYVGY